MRPNTWDVFHLAEKNKEKLRAEAAQLGTTDSVRFIGWLQKNYLSKDD